MAMTDGPWAYDPESGLIKAPGDRSIAYIAFRQDMFETNANGHALAKAPEMAEWIRKVLGAFDEAKEQGADLVVLDASEVREARAILAGTDK